MHGIETSSIEALTSTVTEAAETRRSIRKYEPTAIPREHLLEILRVTSLAPSPWTVQPWRFVIVEDAETKAKLQEAAYGQAQIGSAPAAIVLYSDMTDAIDTIEETVHPGMRGPAGDKAAADIRATFGRMSESDRAAWGYAESNIALGYLLLAARAHGYSTSPMLGLIPCKGSRRALARMRTAGKPALTSAVASASTLPPARSSASFSDSNVAAPRNPSPATLIRSHSIARQVAQATIPTFAPKAALALRHNGKDCHRAGFAPWPKASLSRWSQH